MIGFRSLSITFLLLFTCIIGLAQDAQYAYRIQFADKENSPYSTANPQQYLSERAIQRRQKFNIPITENDLPVNTSYIDSVLHTTGGIYHCSSRWLNQCVILVTDTTDINSLNEIDFINVIKKVGYFPFGLHNKPTGDGDDSIAVYDSNFYAAAWQQIHITNGEYLHQKGFMGEGMLIAVLDVGFANANTINAFDSLFQQNRLADTFNFINHTNDVFSTGSHGTNVLSCMAAYKPNIFVGTAPKSIYALYATDDAATENPIEEDNWIAAAERADNVGADIITTSVGYNIFDDTSYSYSYEQLDGHTTLVAKAANIATSKGILVVTSAGNEGNNSWQHILTPGDADSALTVGSVNYQKTVAINSGYGPNASGAIKPNVCVRGVQVSIYSSSGNITTSSGTSLATPTLAGMAACLMQAFPEKKPTEIRSLIESVSDHFTAPDNHIGYGVPDFRLSYDDVGIAIISNDSFKIFPNPAHDYFNIKFQNPNSKSLSVSIYDITGKMILQATKQYSSNNEISIDIRTLKNGIYFLKISDDKKAVIKKFVKYE